MTAPDPGLTDLIAAHQERPHHDGWICSCGIEGPQRIHAAHVALVVEQHTNGRITELEAENRTLTFSVEDETRDCEGWKIRAEKAEATIARVRNALPNIEGTNPAGLTDKYIVRRVDGSDAEGGRNFGRRYFVLSYDSDPHARAALAAYAASCETDYPELAADLRARLGVREAAPTETEWQTWDAVPDHKPYHGTTENGLLTETIWVNSSGVRRAHRPSGYVNESGDYADYEMHNFAPFVAAEEVSS
ncbi:hypothetical protein [Rhodococcus sp. IEGM 1318]|uniref:hypothetical protein n=1 Tax=Rhodococcus sp. IEGM 1318 TaxID=3082226 RepID=UPI002954B847|nr:hypothetical protein [Rhodococcus sp. IEGM 1318]MDV8005024.1 hypothetical protein [Rhodococcus sp. IEGM 1318]